MMKDKGALQPGAALRYLLAKESLLVAPGVFDPLSARLVEEAGFSLVYASGGAIARSAGLPDLGLLTLTEVAAALTLIVAAVNIPVIADADTGYGNVLNVRRTVQIFERAGVAGFHLEDQEFPKRCGHLAGKSLISPIAMANKIRAARDSLSQPELLIIARTDAIAVEGFAAALARAEQYVAAGADMLFIEAPESLDQIHTIARHFAHVPKLINMFAGGKTPLVDKAQLAAWGYQLVIIPSDLQRAAIYAMQTTLKAIQRAGDSRELMATLTSFQEREALIDTAAYLSWAKTYQEE